MSDEITAQNVLNMNLEFYPSAGWLQRTFEQKRQEMSLPAL
ncbi:MAG: hypothetical protein AAF921_18545 [Cyanobacteria bacterium P01_D01_bin.44]